MLLYPSTTDFDITQSWLISQLIAIILVLIPVLMLIFILRTAPAGSPAAYTASLIGKPVTYVLLPLLGIYFILQCVCMLQYQCDNIMMFLFLETPLWAVIALLTIAALLIFRNGAGQLARICQILAVPIFAVLLFLLITSLFQCDFGELNIMLSPVVSEIPESTLFAFATISGLESALVFALKAKPESRKKALLASYILCGALVIAFLVVVIGMFSLESASSLVYPLTELTRCLTIRSIEFIERYDIVYVYLRITVTIVYCALKAYCACVCFGLEKREGNISLLSWLLAPFLIAGAFFAQEYTTAKLFRLIALYSQVAVLFVLIPTLFVAFLIRKRGRASAKIS